MFRHFLATADLYAEGFEGTQTGDFDAIHRQPTVGAAVGTQQIVDLCGEAPGVLLGAVASFEVEKRRTAAQLGDQRQVRGQVIAAMEVP